MSRKKPPVAPRKPYKDDTDSNSDQEGRPKIGSIMAKVSKFEYYAKQQKNVGRSQFYTTNEIEISPKVFSANSLTVNTPAKDVLGNRNIPNYMSKKQEQKMIVLNENNSLDPKNCSYANVAIRNKTKIDDIVRNFDDSLKNDVKLPKKVNNDQQSRPDNNIYGKINIDRKDCKNNLDCKAEPSKNNLECKTESSKNNLDCKIEKSFNMDLSEYGRLCGVGKVVCLSSPAFDRNPQYSPVYANCHYDRSIEAENMRMKVSIIN